MPTCADTPMPLRIAAITEAADGIRSFELVQPDGTPLPPFTPGSHVKVQVPNGALRKYSLCNAPGGRHRYVMTVMRDAAGQGASVSLFDDAKVGDVIPTFLPNNAFARSSAPRRFCSSSAASASRPSCR